MPIENAPLAQGLLSKLGECLTTKENIQACGEAAGKAVVNTFINNPVAATLCTAAAVVVPTAAIWQRHNIAKGLSAVCSFTFQTAKTPKAKDNTGTDVPPLSPPPSTSATATGSDEPVPAVDPQHKNHNKRR